MRRLRTRPERFDVVFYAPWASSLIAPANSDVPAGGSETQLLKLAIGFAERGLHVGMVVIGNRDALPHEAHGVRVLAQSPRHRSDGALARASLATSALRSMRGLHTDVLVQTNAGPTTAVAALMARLGGARFVYRSASVMDFEFEAHEPRTVNVRLYEWGVRSAAKIVVQTGEQERLCRARFGREAILIRSVADPARRPTARPEAFLWVGRLQPLKRPEAYMTLARAVPEAMFWMIAVPQPDEPPELRRLIESAATELPNLELLEPRTRAGVGELLERTVAVVNTSTREGLPNLFLEGWAQGVPALALSFDPDGLIARHGLGAVAEDSLARLEEEARRLWELRDDRAALAARCIEYVLAEHERDAVVDRWLSAVVHAA